MRLTSLKELDQTEGTVQLQQTGSIDGTSTDQVILVPSPSKTDPNDPLRWPKWKKHVAFTSVCTFTFLTNYSIGGLAPAFYILSIEFDKTMNTTSGLLLWPALVLGLFNFFWVPLANYFGKRPIFVLSLLLFFVCNIWGAMAKGFESLLWSNIIAAFAGSSSEALGAAIVNDLYYLHERGSKMGIYVNCLCAGNSLGPLICGFLIDGLGWRWHKWMAVILTGVNFVAVVLFVPETRYYRTSIVASQNTSTSPPDEAIDAEKSAAAGVKVTRQFSDEGVPQIPKKTFPQDLSLWSGVPSTNLLKMFIRLVMVVTVNLLNPFILQAPPYNWRPHINGLINIPALLGNIFGAWTGGDLVDLFVCWRTKKNHGIFEPESRLYLMVIPCMIAPAGCLVFGYGIQETLSWTALFFGYGMISVGLTATPTITMAYVSDCALPVNPDVLLLINGLKNIVAFGFLYGIIMPWVGKVGYVNCFGTLAGVFVGVVGIGAVLLIVFGARLRHITAQWKIIL